ncbi:MAG: 5-demethoxyubiquinol-8 5-hydroxylase UbiM [Burkholderiales bacterium]|nr:5-demethoxyubiquinol-8 5-hydroxylase UbiM [Burkholderiales bacterium]
MNSDADVLIVGAGPSGLSLAAALADAGLAPLVLEQQPRAALDAPAPDGREIALTHRARRVMEALGLWQRVPEAEVAPLREARVIDGDAPTTLAFGPGDPTLGWLIGNHEIRRAALAAALARPAVQLRCDARVTALALDDDIARLTLADGSVLRAPLVVAADSRFSQTRRLAGIGASMRDFGRSVVVGRVAHAQPNHGIAWECFRYGNTLALLPMNDNRSSAVVTVASHRAPEWLALDDAEFAARIEAQSQGRLGTMRADGPRHHYPLVGVYAHRFVAPRFALIGDAAVGMHPVTAHGYNFGLYGVEVLARELRQAREAGHDIGALPALQAFEREHRRSTLPVYLGTNAIVTLFTDESAPAKFARQAVLRVADGAPLLNGLIKAAITRQLTGAEGRAWPRPPWPVFDKAAKAVQSVLAR